MNPKDIPNTAFITHRVVYAYVMLPFGLTSAGSTYQRAMNKIFKSQIGRNLECYVDDTISKSTTIPGHMEDLKECVENLRKNQLKLNLEKCTFGVGSGTTNKKEVNWSPECQKAFEEIKSYLSQPPVLTKAQPGEPLHLYLSAGAQAVGAALIRYENGKQQPVYYVSQVLKDAETRYPRLEKFAFALVKTSRKLRHYFQGREIKVMTNQPLKKIIHKPDVSGRLVNWAVELSQFNLSFIPRTTIKAQALADFIIECNFPEEEPEPMDMDQESEKDTSPGAWTLKVDGSSTSERSGAGLILKSPEGFTIQTAICVGFPTTNNQAEYEALIVGLKLSRTLRVQDLKIYSDSQIVVKQTNGEYIAKYTILAKYQTLVQSYLASIPKHQVLQICKKENEEADILSKLVRNSSDLDCSVYFEELHKPSIESEEVMEIENNHNWMTPFINYLEKGEVPEDKGKAQRLKAKLAKASPRTSTGETPFKLVYGTEAMISIEVGSPSHRAINFEEEANKEGLRKNMELIDEVRDQAVERMEKYKEKTREHFSKEARVKNFQVGDLVLRDNEASDPINTGKLMPKWEGPYKIKEVLRLGTYKLLNMDGSEVPNTWHGLRLRKFYQ
ncbi:uncharacterized protein LOC141680456 [Apium graveolens]|uniref:uncharacterized protein LOC141680456 n=1 Tax=Apium graveolens TaxID=4045 RepID=UPI003D798844